MEEMVATLAPERWKLKNMIADLPPRWVIIQMGLGEVFGTAILLMFGCMGDLSSLKTNVPHFISSIAFGMAVMLIITTFGHISQAHLNPGVTICASILGGLPILLAPYYIICQCIGSIGGFWFAKLLVPEKYHKDFCVTRVHPDFNWYQGFLAEFFSSSILILVCCGVWDPRQATKGGSTPLKFGFGITTLAVLMGEYTGCSMNSARTLGPALLGVDDESWGNFHWVYWVAPNLAGALITIIYMVFCGTPKPKK
ncbi:aquaporin AQPcic-like [Chrysoperla carnea]|uniref:aquaporin AQPcic-like n=1 Tax=Chrysoperla carnea TaxID=189513 RepID=UPI001D06A6A2|nr:aquaporin AQPcic-like [Chrysoperla carnea]